MSEGGRPSLRPLRVRLGTRFECEGDGLCCTDAHALGPVDAYAGAILDLFVPGSLALSDDGEYRVMALDPSTGACVFRSEGLCSLHAAQGAELKPDPCRRYPLGLTATPSGGRVVTEHACPCRTMGERPLLDAEVAAESVKDREGLLSPNAHVRAPVRLSDRLHVGWADWEKIEEKLIEGLLGGAPIEALLEVAPFGAIEGEGWEAVGEDYAAHPGEARHDVALRWFGSELLACLGRRGSELPRPWRAEMERGEARSPEVGDVDVIFADWVADEIWSMRWTYDGTFEQKRGEVSTRLAVARRVQGSLARRGVRSDTAAAEAVMIVDLVGGTPRWRELIATLVHAPLGRPTPP